jgi:hypothetical protein
MDHQDEDEGEESHPLSKPIPTRLANLQLTSLRDFPEKDVALGEGYVLKLQDVVVGSKGSRETHRHPGNERFRVTVEIRLMRYGKAANRMEKIQLVKEVVDAVKQSGGNFVRQQDGVWYDIGTVKAREKAGHALRRALSKQEQKTREERLLLEPLPIRPLPDTAASSSAPFSALHDRIVAHNSLEATSQFQGAGNFGDALMTQESLRKAQWPAASDRPDQGNHFQELEPLSLKPPPLSKQAKITRQESLSLEPLPIKPLSKNVRASSAPSLAPHHGVVAHNASEVSSLFQGAGNFGNAQTTQDSMRQAQCIVASDRPDRTLRPDRSDDFQDLVRSTFRGTAIDGQTYVPHERLSFGDASEEEDEILDNA